MKITKNEFISNHLLAKHGLAKLLMINTIDGMFEESKIYDQKSNW